MQQWQVLEQAYIYFSKSQTAFIVVFVSVFIVIFDFRYVGRSGFQKFSKY